MIGRLVQMQRQLDRRADCDGKEQRARDGQLPIGLDCLVLPANALHKGPAFGLSEPVAHHDQPDAADHNRVGWQGEQKAGGEEQKSDKSHSGKPFSDDDIGKAFEAFAQKGIHALYSMRERVGQVRRVSGSAHQPSLYCGAFDFSSTCCGFLQIKTEDAA